MATVSVTNTLANGDVPDASLWNTNYTDITTWLNNRYNGTDTWLFMKVSGTSGNCADISGSAATTELSLNNTATDGDPMLTFKLSGSQTHVIGVDDSDSDFLKFATTGLTANVAMQIPTAGASVQFASGSGSAPGVSFISSTNTGLFYSSGLVAVVAGNNVWSATDTAQTWSIGGTGIFESSSSYLRPVTNNAINLGTSANKWVEVFAVAGTINTSHSSTKTNISPLLDFHIPPAVRYDRNGRSYIGYLNDGLPSEARPRTETGEVDEVSNYEAAVVGELCAGWYDHESRLKRLEASVA